MRELLPDRPVANEHAQDDQEAELRAGTLDAAFVRLPLDRDGLHLVRLYDELPVVVVPLDHLLTVDPDVSSRDLVDEQHVLPPPGGLELRVEQLSFPSMSAREAIEVVASGTGVVVLPMSVARLFRRKDVTYRPVVDLPATTVGLAWRVERDDEQVQRLVGVVRGRTSRSSRG